VLGQSPVASILHLLFGHVLPLSILAAVGAILGEPLFRSPMDGESRAAPVAAPTRGIRLN
jgi:hypothetical protein